MIEKVHFNINKTDDKTIEYLKILNSLVFIFNLIKKNT